MTILTDLLPQFLALVGAVTLWLLVLRFRGIRLHSPEARAFAGTREAFRAQWAMWTIIFAGVMYGAVRPSGGALRLWDGVGIVFVGAVIEGLVVAVCFRYLARRQP